MLRFGTKPRPLYTFGLTGRAPLRIRVPIRFSVPPLRALALAFGVVQTTVPHHAGPQRPTSMTTLRFGLVQRPSTEAWAEAGTAARNSNAMARKSRFM